MACGTERSGRAYTDIERTKRVVQGAMQGLTDCLTFTVETEEDFSDGWLPTLDMKLRVNKANQIEYNFFEKPTGSSKCLQASTALNPNCLIRSLNNEMMRRLSNMNEHIPMEEKTEVLDKFSAKHAARKVKKEKTALEEIYCMSQSVRDV